MATVRWLVTGFILLASPLNADTPSTARHSLADIRCELCASPLPGVADTSVRAALMQPDVLPFHELHNASPARCNGASRNQDSASTIRCDPQKAMVARPDAVIVRTGLRMRRMRMTVIVMGM